MPTHEEVRYRVLRRWAIFWVVFVMICAFLGCYTVLYALGYRINWKEKRLVLTSVLYLNSQPSGATIYLDGKEIGQTKKVIREIFPGFYHLKLEKEGYWPWEHTIEVKPYTLVEVVPTLFRQKPIKEKEIKFDRLLKASNCGVAFEKDGKNFWFVFEGEKAISLPKGKLRFLGEEVLVEGKNWTMVSKDGSQKTLPKISAKKVWVKNKKVYALTSEGKLWRIDENEQKLLAEKAKDFAFFGSTLWAIKEEQLAEYSLGWQEKGKEFEVSNHNSKKIKVKDLRFCSWDTPSPCFGRGKDFFLWENNKMLWLGKNLRSLSSYKDQIAWLTEEGEISWRNREGIAFLSRYYSSPASISFLSLEHLLLRFPSEVKVLEISTLQEFPVFKEQTKAVFPLSVDKIAIVQDKKLTFYKITEPLPFWERIFRTFRK